MLRPVSHTTDPCAWRVDPTPSDGDSVTVPHSTLWGVGSGARGPHAKKVSDKVS